MSLFTPGGPSMSVVFRSMMAGATVVTAGMGFLVEGDERWFAASAVFGIVWLLWDVVVHHVFEPFGHWTASVLAGETSSEAAGALRPTLDDTIRLLESHLERDTSRQVAVNAGVRLEEIYRTVKRDPTRARDVIRRVRERHPDAAELERFRHYYEDEEPGGTLPG